MRYFFSSPMMGQSFAFTPMMWWLTPLLIWSLIWKGLALWKSARNNQLYWFIPLLILNTAGLLEIAYLAFFQKNSSCCGGQNCNYETETKPKTKIKKRPARNR